MAAAPAETQTLVCPVTAPQSQSECPVPPGLREREGTAAARCLLGEERRGGHGRGGTPLTLDRPGGRGGRRGGCPPALAGPRPRESAALGVAHDCGGAPPGSRLPRVSRSRSEDG